ncbi:hypothetical protein [Streptomyces sp. NPDC047061]|uniref:hypothetical protein n=1 Tax=Streptomyces sp. NPDC047061 TaxID=3154605 RepID=UPI0033CE372A
MADYSMRNTEPRSLARTNYAIMAGFIGAGAIGGFLGWGPVGSLVGLAAGAAAGALVVGVRLLIERRRRAAQAARTDGHPSHEQAQAQAGPTDGQAQARAWAWAQIQERQRAHEQAQAQARARAQDRAIERARRLFDLPPYEQAQAHRPPSYEQSEAQTAAQAEALIKAREAAEKAALIKARAREWAWAQGRSSEEVDTLILPVRVKPGSSAHVIHSYNPGPDRLDTEVYQRFSAREDWAFHYSLNPDSPFAYLPLTQSPPVSGPEPVSQAFPVQLPEMARMAAMSPGTSFQQGGSSGQRPLAGSTIQAPLQARTRR